MQKEVHTGLNTFLMYLFSYQRHQNALVLDSVTVVFNGSNQHKSCKLVVKIVTNLTTLSPRSIQVILIGVFRATFNQNLK